MRVASRRPAGSVVGLALYVSPLTVGGGDLLTQQLLTGAPGLLVPAVLGYFLIRFVTGARPAQWPGRSGGTRSSRSAAPSAPATSML